tara:strand:+ start:131 stop:469 length:339 start_codon:yes stop_codon:yes gene_type:complete
LKKDYVLNVTEAKRAKIAEELKEFKIENADYDMESESLIDIAVGDAVIENYEHDDVSYIGISAEYNHTATSIDYYGEFRGGYSYINPSLEKWAEKKGLYWEWMNAAVIVLVA